MRYAYLFEWDDFYAPKALYALQKAGVLVKVANTKFSIPVGNSNTQFDYGTIMIPVQMQNKNSDELYAVIKKVAEENSINIYGVTTGNAITGSDLGK